MPPRVTRSSARLAAESSSTNHSSDPPQPPSTPLPSTRKRKASPPRAESSPSQGTNTRISRSRSKRLKVDENSTEYLSGFDAQQAQAAFVQKDEAMSTAGYEGYPSQATFSNPIVDHPLDTQTRIPKSHPHPSQTSNLAPSLPTPKAKSQKVHRILLLS